MHVLDGRNIALSFVNRFPWAFAYGSLWPSVIVCIFSAVYCLICAMLLTHGCEVTGTFEYSALLRFVSPKLEKIGAIAICYVVFSTCLGYCIIIPQFLQPAFSEMFDIARFPHDHRMYILIASPLILYPLCLLKDLSSLRFSSIIGILAIFYCLGLFVYESIEHHKNGEAPGTASDPNAVFLTNHWSTGIFIVVNVAAKANVIHYALPPIYESLRNRSPKRMWIVVSVSYVVVTAIYLAFAICGYYLFGSDAQGNVLENFRGESGAAVAVARLGTCLSIFGCFPLIFKAGINALETQFFSTPDSRWNFRENPKTRVGVITILIAILTLISLFIDDIGPVTSIEGAVTVLLLICAFPIMIYWKVVLSGDYRKIRKKQKSYDQIERVSSPSPDALDNIMLEETSSRADDIDIARKEITDEGSPLLRKLSGIGCRRFGLCLLFVMGIGMGIAGLVMSIKILNQEK